MNENTHKDAREDERERAVVERVSLASDGTEANGVSYSTKISANGRYVTYISYASNLVSGDTNDTSDVFVFDRKMGTTERISVASDGTEGNGFSFNPVISANGRYVAYESNASNLVSGDTYGSADIFVYDRKTGTTERISVPRDSTEENGVSNIAPEISANGRYVTYWSDASNLVPGDTNGTTDVFVFDRKMGTTERVSVASDGTEGNNESSAPAISANGRYVTFASWASNLVSDDSNGFVDIFVFDQKTGTTERISVASDGTEGNNFSVEPAISANGRYVTYYSGASNLVPGDTNDANDIFVFDRKTGTTERVSVASDGSEANDHSFSPQISANGRYVTYNSDASNLVPGDTNGTTDIFVFDRKTGTTERISVASDGTEGNGFSFEPAISANGHYITYNSDASNLVPGDTNGTADIFVASTYDCLL
jgi:tricorn protease-like protein